MTLELAPTRLNSGSQNVSRGWLGVLSTQQTAESINTRSPARELAAPDGTTRPPLPFGLLFIFVVGFALRYWYCFLFPHFNSYQAADAYGFLKNAEALLDLSKYPVAFWHEVWQCLLGTASQTTCTHVKEMLAPLRDIPNSGLVMPTYLACCYLLSGSQFSIANWMPPVFVQCLVSAFIGVFVALTGTCVFNKRVGLLSGILCAVYPAFIVNTNRLYGEILAACLVSVICFLTVRTTIESQTGEELGPVLCEWVGDGCAAKYAVDHVPAHLAGDTV